MNVTAYAITTELGSAKNGTEQIAVTFQVIDEDADGKRGPLHGHRKVWYGFFTDNTTDRTLESLRHCGWGSDELSDIANLDENACRRLLPKVVQLVIENETYNGRTVEKVRWVNSLEETRSAIKNKADDAAVKSLSARMRSRAAALRVANKPKGDIPF
jgi:hypothetical protein